MIRTLILALALSSAAPALADETAEEARQARIEARRHDLEAQLAARRERKAQLEKERDAARMNANVYVLPKYKLEAEEKQKQIDAVDAEIAEIEAQLEALE